MKNNKLLIMLLIIIIVLISFLQINGKSKKIDASMQKVSDESGDETQILLYFLDNAETKLVPEYRYVSLGKIKENMIETVISELLKRTTNSRK